MLNLVGLPGKKVRLVPLDFELHFENTVDWMSDPEVTKYISQNLPTNKIKQDAYFRRMMESPNDAIWAILDPDGNHIGNTNIQSINWKERYASSGMIIGDKNSRGKGFAVDSHLVKLKFAFEELGLNRIETDIFEENIAAIKTCEKAGWKQEGIARQKYFRRGKWHNIVHFAYIAEDYFKTNT